MSEPEKSSAQEPSDNGSSVRIFFSYARGDDEPFVARLHADLTARGFDVWWDRVSMPARGLTFLHEIRDAIDARERFLLVVGPKATTSDYVIAEWRHAVTYGKAINPILRLGDFPLVPDELKLLHVEDFRDDTHYAFHLEKLVRQLSECVAPMGKLVGLPSLPRHLLTRPDCLQSLKDSLLADLQRPVVVTAVAARVGVHGMGGVGKSVLANLLARDTDVRRGFPDGIIWVPLGTEPHLVELQRNIAKVFEDPGCLENVTQGRAKLGELLATKAVLLVLDDVWERAHAEAFSVLGSRCRAVITTRDAGLVTSFLGTQHPVQLLTEAESLRLLAGAAGVTPNDLPSEAKAIVSECGCLPLAVALCAGMFTRGVAWNGILQRLKQTALEGIGDRNAENAQHRNLWTAMKVSVDALKPDEQKRFIELSVFSNDEAIPETAVSMLWSHTGRLNAFSCENLLISLSERSLIRIDAETPRIGHTPRRRVSLHDLLYDFASQLAQEPLLLHKQLLDAYRKLCPDGWTTGPNDGYLFHHLPTHLARGNSWQELKSLVEDGRLHLLRRWTETGQYNQGIECLRGLIEASVATDKSFAAGLATQLARIYSRLDHFDDAEAWLLKALRWCPWWSSRRTRAVAYHELASLRLYLGKTDESERLYRRALRLCRIWLPTLRDEASANLVALASLNLDRFQYSQAEAMAGQALQEARRSGDVAHTIAANQLLAIASKDRSDFGRAKELLEAGMILAKMANLPFQKTGISIVSGWLSYQQAALESKTPTNALEIFQTALREAEHLNHLPYTVGALLGLAQSHFLVKDVQAARSRLGQAAHALASTDHRQAMSVWLALEQASLTLLDGELKAATERFRTVIQCARALENRSREADAWVGLGAVHFHQHQANEAEECWRKAEIVAQTACPLRHRLVLKGIESNRTGVCCVPL